MSAELSPRALLVLTILGLAARVLLAAVSCGTNDAATFFRFGEEINRQGLFTTYRQDVDLNHPPIPSLWAAAAYKLTGSHPRPVDPNDPAAQADPAAARDAAYEPPPLAFCFVLKLPSLLADGAAAWLIWKLLRPRLGPRGALAVAAAYAWSLDAILVSGYHCNTDPVYAFLILLCVYLLQEKDRFFLAGLAMGAAVNVKLTPLILVAPLLLSCRRWSEAGQFVAGMALCAVPFVPLVFGPADLREHFRANAVAYNSYLSRWGINFLLLPKGEAMPQGVGTAEWGERFVVGYYDWGRYLILALIASWAVAARVLRRWDRYEVAAVTLAIFLVFTGGFGVQYTVMLLPLLFVIRPALAKVYSLLAGLFLAAVYFTYWTGTIPLYSKFRGDFPMVAAWIGVLAWGALIYFLWVTLRRSKLVTQPQ